MGLGSINEQINYSNYKRYGNYSVTQTNPFWNKRDSELTFNVYIRQVEDSMQIINSTTDPLTFFYRFDFVIKRYIDLCNMSRYIKSKRDFIKETKNLINLKSQYVQSLIIRVYKKSSEKVLSLKTEKGKINHVKKIEDSFLPFHDEMTNENLIFLNSVIEKLKSGNDLGNIPAPPIINNSPVTQVENNMKNKSNLPIIITIVVLLLFSCCCCGSIGGSKDKDDENSSQAEITTTVQTEGTTTVITAEKTTSTKKTTTVKKTTVVKTTTTEPPTTEKLTESPTEPPTPAPTNPPTSPLSEPKVIKFILNVESGCVHTSSNCNAAEKILPENYAEIEIAEDELVNYAYTYWACGKCSKRYSNELPKF